MIIREFEVARSRPTSDSADRKKSFLAAASVIGAALTSACCVGPLVLLTLGISGAWIGNLTALEPYKPVFAAIAMTFIGLGFRHVYFTAKVTCTDGTYCARPVSALIAKIALWTATVLVALAVTIDWWAPVLY
jgi:mercuric ion transport protein